MVIASIGIAGAIIYGLILFLSESAGVALTLPGIAGLIVGIGVTADSFIVLFERIRDEMRDGKSIRVAIESGWERAKWTCVVADSVSLLAAVVLFIFAIGAVKGFAFMLGITTVIDLVVFFFFTKPMITWLAQFKFFGNGHKLSGLSAAAGGHRPHRPGRHGGRLPMSRFAALGRDLYDGDVSVNFVGRKWLWYALSAIVIAVSIYGLTVQKLNWGIEFEGGVEYRVAVGSAEATQENVEAIREAVMDTGIANASAPIVNTSGTDNIRVQTEPLSNEEATQVSKAIQDVAGVETDAISQDDIGASWGQQVAERALTGSGRLPGAGHPDDLGLLP